MTINRNNAEDDDEDQEGGGHGNLRPVTNSY